MGERGAGFLKLLISSAFGSSSLKSLQYIEAKHVKLHSPLINFFVDNFMLQAPPAEETASIGLFPT
jgi:hypothetical protein